MAAHIKRRKDRGDFIYYLIDGDMRRSLKTTSKGIAQELLKQYNRGKFSVDPLPTVKVFYSRWISTKIEPLYRRAQARDYADHFRKHILAKWTDSQKHVRDFGPMRLDALKTTDLVEFRIALLNKDTPGGTKLSMKTCRNIIDGSFRAMFRDARGEYTELQGYDPFLHLQWQKSQREKPDPFTAEERDRIVEYWKATDFFYFPWVFTLFHTGMRPSELSALTWNDVNMETGTVSITKSRYMGDDGAPKTYGSNRVIEIDGTVVEVLKLLPSRALGLKHVFVNKDGKPVNAKKWSEHNWKEPLKDLGIRHRKFYATRHTFITEKIRDGENPFRLAQYCGTSVSMIERDYCGTLGLSTLGRSGNNPVSDRTKIAPLCENPSKIVVAGPGFEPGTSRL
jgi:integrase